MKSVASHIEKAPMNKQFPSVSSPQMTLYRLSTKTGEKDTEGGENELFSVSWEGLQDEKQALSGMFRH